MRNAQRRARASPMSGIGSLDSALQNIGNALGALGVQSTCGFGAAARAIHGPDEAAKIEDLDKVYRSYRDTLVAIMGE